MKKLDFKESNIASKQEFDPKVPKGEVISQEPDAGEEVAPKEAQLSFVVSKGPETVEMPYLIGYNERDARTELSSQGLGNNPIKIEEVFNSAAEGAIIAQDPESGEEIVPGKTELTFTISKGLETETVPDVVNQSVANARKALQDAGFKVSTQEEYSDSVDKDRVIAANPAAGTVLEVGATVTLTISKGQETKTTSTESVSSSSTSSSTQFSESVPLDSEDSTAPIDGTSEPVVPDDSIISTESSAVDVPATEETEASVSSEVSTEQSIADDVD